MIWQMFALRSRHRETSTASDLFCDFKSLQKVHVFIQCRCCFNLFYSRLFLTISVKLGIESLLQSFIHKGPSKICNVRVINGNKIFLKSHIDYLWIYDFESLVKCDVQIREGDNVFTIADFRVTFPAAEPFLYKTTYSSVTL